MWGKPAPTLARKTSPGNPERLESQPSAGNTGNKKLRLGNIVTITEPKPIEGENLDWDKYEIFDWDEALRKHIERLEQERVIKADRLKLKAEKEFAWRLYRDCKEYLEENERNWQLGKEARKAEERKQERLAQARWRQQELKERVLERKVKESIESLPTDERLRIQKAEAREKRLELQATKKSLYKLRNKEKVLARKSDWQERLDKISSLEDKLKKLQEISEEIERKHQEMEERKAQEKIKKERERQEKILKAEKLRQKWEMLRWVTSFLSENQEMWEQERLENENKARLELEAWKKMKRLEKVAFLKKSWQESGKEKGVPVSPPSHPDSFKVWREKVPTQPKLSQSPCSLTQKASQDTDIEPVRPLAQNQDNIRYTDIRLKIKPSRLNVANNQENIKPTPPTQCSKVNLELAQSVILDILEEISEADVKPQPEHSKPKPRNYILPGILLVETTPTPTPPQGKCALYPEVEKSKPSTISDQKSEDKTQGNCTGNQNKPNQTNQTPPKPDVRKNLNLMLKPPKPNQKPTIKRQRKPAKPEQKLKITSFLSKTNPKKPPELAGMPSTVNTALDEVRNQRALKPPLIPGNISELSRVISPCTALSQHSHQIILTNPLTAEQQLSKPDLAAKLVQHKEI